MRICGPAGRRSHVHLFDVGLGIRPGEGELFLCHDGVGQGADAVVVEPEERRNSVTLRVHVAPSDMGRVIGRRGRVAQAIRSVVRAAGAKEGVDATVDIVD